MCNIRHSTVFIPSLFIAFFWPHHPCVAVEYTWSQIPLQGMGFVTGVVAHPAVDDLVYVRTDVGGIYRWLPEEDSWLPLNDGAGTGYGVESFALDPTNPDLLYAAIATVQKGSGTVWKSTDQGESWDATGLNVYMEPNGSWRHAGERLMVDPHSSTVLYYASVDSGLLKSTDQGMHWMQIDTTRLPPGRLGGQTFVVADPTSGSAGVACSRLYVGVQGYGMYRSDDGGDEWHLVADGPDTTFKPVRGAMASNGILYISYAARHNGGPGKVYRCNATSSLTDITPANAGSAGFAGITVLGEQVLAQKWNAGPQDCIHFSLNGGTSWSDLHFNNGTQAWSGSKNVTEPAYYPDWSSWTNAGAVLLDPRRPGRAWLTTGFAVYRTTNIAGSPAQWEAVMDNLEELVATALCKPPVPGSTRAILGSMDMFGFVVDTNFVVPTSKLIPGKFGIMTGIDFCEADPATVVYVGSAQHQAWDLFSGVSRSGGETWTPFSNTPQGYSNGAIALSATDPDHWLWAPANDYWDPVFLPVYTTDGGQSWQQSSGLPEAFNGASHLWAANRFISSDRVDGKLFYYYTHFDENNWAGLLYRSTDGGASFALVNETVPYATQITMAAVPGREGHLLLTSRSGGPLVLSRDRGETFEEMPGLVHCTHFSTGAPIPPSTEPTLFAAGSTGGAHSLYQSVDYGQTWHPIGAPGFPFDKVAVLEGDRLHSGRLYVGTGGRGFFLGEAQPALSSAPYSARRRVTAQTVEQVRHFDLRGRAIDQRSAGAVRVQITANHRVHATIQRRRR